jgi:diacylglycerol kinase family enzyme
LISRAETENLDVFSVNDKLLFCNYFSIGFDAVVVRDFDAMRSSRLAGFLPPGRLTNNALYFLAGVKRAGFRLPPPVEMEIVKDGETHAFCLKSPCFAIIISNLPVYAGGCKISPEAEKDDGIFEVTIVRNIFEFLRLVLTRFIPFLKAGSGSGGSGRYRAEEASIRLQSPAPCQIDGEKCSETDAPAPTVKIRLRDRIRVLKTSLK